MLESVGEVLFCVAGVTENAHYRRVCWVGYRVNRVGFELLMVDGLCLVLRWFTSGACRFVVSRDRFVVVGIQISCLFFACVLNGCLVIVGVVYS